VALVVTACGAAASPNPEPSPSASPSLEPSPIASPSPSASPSTSASASPSPPGSVSPEPSPSPSPAPSVAPPSAAASSSPLDPASEAAIMANLESQIGVDVSSAVVASVREATWPNGAMGCPKPNESYIEAIVNGFRVVVSFDGALYDYRVSDAGAVRFCGLA
jgi:hypothetical protein